MVEIFAQKIPLLKAFYGCTTRVTIFNATELHTLDRVKVGDFVMCIFHNLKKFFKSYYPLSDSFIDTKGLQLIYY